MINRNYLLAIGLISTITVVGCNAKVHSESTVDPKETDGPKPVSNDTTSEQSSQNTALTATTVTADKASEEQSKMSKNAVAKSGTIVFQDLEGGFFSFIANDGSKYTPMNLDEQYKINGLEVDVKGNIVTGMMTTTQFGHLLKIEEIEKK